VRLSGLDFPHDRKEIKSNLIPDAPLDEPTSGVDKGAKERRMGTVVGTKSVGTEV
jgi:hypothetical protein